jgi:hypothetical protein
MHIDNLEETKTAAGKRISARVHWEENSRPAQELFFETAEEYGDGLACSAHPFVVACLIPAMRWGERRLIVEAAVCPELVEGLATAVAVLQHWIGPERKAVAIESCGSYRPARRNHPYEGSFLSGGVDSLATLRMNHQRYPADHPRTIHDCLMVHGFDTGSQDPAMEVAVFQRNFEAAQTAALDAGVCLIPVTTNLRTLDSRVDFWMEEFCGAGLAAVAHAFDNWFSAVAIASTYDIHHLTPAASHPLLDPHYSSSALLIRHDGIRFSRLDKLRVVADWPAGLQNVRVCTTNDPEQLNCGRCEKCIRTMTMLLALGKLDQTEAFPAQDVSPELLDTITFTYPYQDLSYREAAPLLAQRGRDDLVQVIEAKSAAFHRYERWHSEQDWKGVVKRFDRKWLHSALYQSYRGLRRHASRPAGPLKSRRIAG